MVPIHAGLGRRMRCAAQTHLNAPRLSAMDTLADTAAAPSDTPHTDQDDFDAVASVLDTQSAQADEVVRSVRACVVSALQDPDLPHGTLRDTVQDISKQLTQLPELNFPKLAMVAAQSQGEHCFRSSNFRFEAGSSVSGWAAVVALSRGCIHSLTRSASCTVPPQGNHQR